jgi:transposase
VVKLFELEVSARTMAQQIGVSYNTAHRAATILRMAILAHAEDAEILLSGEIA